MNISRSIHIPIFHRILPRIAGSTSNNNHLYCSTQPGGLSTIYSKLLKIVLLFSTLLLPPAATALEQDKSELIKIQSDTAEFNEAKGTAIYRGKVELEQGSLIIKSNSLTIFNSETGVSKVLAEGDPAHYEQLVEQDKPPVRADAKQIIYLPQDDSISLEGNAKLFQGENKFEGEHIHYDLKRHVLNAKGGGESSDPSSTTSSSGRVKMVIPPVRKPKDSN